MLAEVGIERPLLVTSERWRGLDLPGRDASSGVEVAVASAVAEAAAAAEGADGAPRARRRQRDRHSARRSRRRRGLPLVSVPTTYSGAEWTPFFGVRDADRRMQGGGGGAHLAGDRLRAGAHARPAARRVRRDGDERARPLRRGALRPGRTTRPTRRARRARALIAEWLPRVARRRPTTSRRGAAARGRDARRRRARRRRGLALGHAMAQAVGGRYGIPHGAANAICLPPALRFNAEVAADAIARLRRGDRRATRSSVSRELARLAGYRAPARPRRAARTTCPRWPRRRAAVRREGEPAAGVTRRDRGAAALGLLRLKRARRDALPLGPGRRWKTATVDRRAGGSTSSRRRGRARRRRSRRDRRPA